MVSNDNEELKICVTCDILMLHWTRAGCFHFHLLLTFLSSSFLSTLKLFSATLSVLIRISLQLAACLAASPPALSRSRLLPVPSQSYRHLHILTLYLPLSCNSPTSLSLLPLFFTCRAVWVALSCQSLAGPAKQHVSVREEARASGPGVVAGPVDLPPLSSAPPQQIEPPAGRHGAHRGPMLRAHMPQNTNSHLDTRARASRALQAHLHIDANMHIDAQTPFEIVHGTKQEGITNVNLAPIKEYYSCTAVKSFILLCPFRTGSVKREQICLNVMTATIITDCHDS